MKAAGAILLAKTNHPEFSYACESENLLTGRTNNLWNLERTPGGSSGGESAAIAAELSPMGLGTDLSISLRGPSAMTGIMALKPTHGRIPMTGIYGHESLAWRAGPMAGSARHLALAYSVVAGPDGQDAFSSLGANFDAGVGATPKRQLKAGLLVEPSFGPIDPEVGSTVRAAAEALKAAGCAVESVRIPGLERHFALDVFIRIHVNEMKPAMVQITSEQPEEKIFKNARDMLNTPETPMPDFVNAEEEIEWLKDGFAEYF